MGQEEDHQTEVVQSEQPEDWNRVRVQAEDSARQLQYCCYVVDDWQRAFAASASPEAHKVPGSSSVAGAVEVPQESVTLGLLGTGPGTSGVEIGHAGVDAGRHLAQETLLERET